MYYMIMGIRAELNKEVILLCVGTYYTYHVKTSNYL